MALLISIEIVIPTSPVPVKVGVVSLVIPSWSDEPVSLALSRLPVIDALLSTKIVPVISDSLPAISTDESV